MQTYANLLFALTFLPPSVFVLGLTLLDIVLAKYFFDAQVRTIPDAWPNEMNTCGRIAALALASGSAFPESTFILLCKFLTDVVEVHNSGHFVLVSNRGQVAFCLFPNSSCSSLTLQK